VCFVVDVGVGDGDGDVVVVVYGMCAVCVVVDVCECIAWVYVVCSSPRLVFVLQWRVLLLVLVLVCT